MFASTAGALTATGFGVTTVFVAETLLIAICATKPMLNIEIDAVASVENLIRTLSFGTSKTLFSASCCIIVRLSKFCTASISLTKRSASIITALPVLAFNTLAIVRM